MSFIKMIIPERFLRPSGEEPHYASSASNGYVKEKPQGRDIYAEAEAETRQARGNQEAAQVVAAFTSLLGGGRA